MPKYVVDLRLVVHAKNDAEADVIAEKVLESTDELDPAVEVYDRSFSTHRYRRGDPHACVED